MTQKGGLMAEGEADGRAVMRADELSRARCLSVIRLARLEEKHLSAAMGRFLSGLASNDEVRVIVRHLLARCPVCTNSAQRSLSKSRLLALPEVAEPE